MQRLRFPALALLFTAVLMPALFFFLPSKDYSATERRYLAKTPEITLDKLIHGELSEEFEDYLTDHFPGRNFFVGVNAYWNLLTGRNTAGEVYYCKENYLIRAPQSCTTEQLETNLERFDRFAENTGLPSTLFLIPTAGDVLSDLLPGRHAPYRYDACLNLAGRYCPHLNIPNLKQVLTNARSSMPYYRTDHHLTSAGCYAVYDAFCRTHGRMPPPREAYTITSYNGFCGSAWTSSGYWLTPSESLEIWDAGIPLRVTILEGGEEARTADSVFFLDNLQSDDLYTVFLDGNHTLVRIENPAADGGRLLLLRDSYAHCLAPFLARDYQEILLVDLRFYRMSVSALIETYGITELGIVYGLDNLLTDTNSAWLG